MMVTFVSQCEKNALKKTRRVLDAFANRIGDNTWQTVITQEGLNAVKKLLRKTASKSTAVSCHWIRSRARSELLWVVGNKKQFGFGGVVPVNSTDVTDIKQDEKRIMTETAYANSQKQLLSRHLFAVGQLAGLLVEKLIADDSKLKLSAFVAGCFHDIGKLDPEFRSWLESKISKSQEDEIEVSEDGVHVDKGKFSFEKHPRHNEISLWLTQFSNISELLVNSKQRDFIEHTVYWHHAKPVRREDYVSFHDIHRKLKSAYREKGLKQLVEHANKVMHEVVELAKNHSQATFSNLAGVRFLFDEDVVSSFRKLNLPPYKQYDPEDEIDDYVHQINFNAKANFIRACVISADRIISALSADDLDRLIEEDLFEELVDKGFEVSSSLSEQIEGCLVGFESKYPGSERNEKQSTVANEMLNAESVAVLSGPAGCGKTKIALEWAKLTSANKIIWVCPRVQVCEGLFKGLTSDEYLPNAKVEICTGEIKETHLSGEISATLEGQEFSGDIVLTTIDQVINSITTHGNVTALVDFMNAHVVFDEYHEYVPMPAFNLLFAELVKCKQLQGHHAHTLLVSATPNYAYVGRLLEIDSEDIFDIESFNQSQYQISFQPFNESEKNGENPLFALQPINSIVISNTATTAQLAYISNQTEENAIVFHGKFKVSDKKEMFDQIYKAFKQRGSKNFDVLRSGPIIQASLNITCNHMVTELTVAENWLQRLGRLDRFGENESVNEYVTAIPYEIVSSNGKVKGNCARFLNSSHCYRSAFAWYEFLEDKQLQEPITIGQIYQFYKEFYQSDKVLAVVEQDLISALKGSVSVIKAKVHDPIRFIKKTSAKSKKKLKKSSLRGDSRFVQMAKLMISESGELEFKNEYAIDWQESDGDFVNCYTESLESIRNSGLIDYAAKKQERITPDSPIKGISAKNMGLRKQILEGAAVEPENPIYLSYTPGDLTDCLGESEPDSSATYYVFTEKQIVGAMPLDKLINH